MTENKKKQRFMALPIENHETAAWINSSKDIKPLSQVVIPTEYDVQNAKEWVDDGSQL